MLLSTIKSNKDKGIDININNNNKDINNNNNNINKDININNNNNNNNNKDEYKQLEYELEFMGKQLNQIQQMVKGLERRIDNGEEFKHMEFGMSLLEVKSHLLLMYCTRLLLYISQRIRGQTLRPRYDELLQQMALLCWISDKVRNIQKQCQYSIDKLLQYAKQHQHQGTSITTNNTINNNKTAISSSSSSNTSMDDLSHKPDMNDLRPLDPSSSSSSSAANKNSYQPVKINPMDMEMEDPLSQLTKKQQRLLEQHKREVRRGDIYQSLKGELTNLPEEEHFHMNLRSTKEEKALEEYEENTMTRTRQSKKAMVEKAKNERRIQQSHGENLDAFVDNMRTQFEMNSKLARFTSGGPSFANTIGLFHKNKPTSNFAKLGVKGPWYMRKKLAWKMSDKGKAALSRRKWKKSHPLPFNPSKLRNMKGKTRKAANKVLGIASKSRKIKKLIGKRKPKSKYNNK